MNQHSVRIAILAAGLAGLLSCAHMPTPVEPPLANAYADAIFLKVATDFAQGQYPGSLAGYYAIVVHAPSFDRLSSDADLGPFLSSARAHADSAVVVVTPPAAGHTVAVFFKNATAVAYSSIEPNREPTPAVVDVKRTGLSADVTEGREELFFEAVNLFADDDTPIPAHRILSAGPR